MGPLMASESNLRPLDGHPAAVGTLPAAMGSFSAVRKLLLVTRKWFFRLLESYFYSCVGISDAAMGIGADLGQCGQLIG